MNTQDREAYENWFRAEYGQEPMPRTSPAHDFCYAGWKARGASTQAREDELVAHVERLLEALSIAMVGGDYLATERNQLESVLAATPKQSLARLRNQMREECAALCDKQTSTNELFMTTMWEISIAIRAMKEPE